MIKNLLPKLAAAVVLAGFGAAQSAWAGAIQPTQVGKAATALNAYKTAEAATVSISTVTASPGAQAFAPGNVEQVLLKATATAASGTGSATINSITIDFGNDASKAQADLQNVKVFTSTNSNFVGDARNEAVLVGETAAISGQSVTVNLTKTPPVVAAGGSVTFYITADVKATATVGNSINAVLKSIVFNTNQTKNVNADPEGAAQIFSVESMPYKPYDLQSHYWRIPAMVVLRNQKDTSKNGRIVTMADMRFNHGADLPNHIDVYERHSDDNGKTWSEAKLVAGGEEDEKLVPTGNHGFGDAALVETASGKLVAIMVAGAFYFSSTPSAPNIPFIVTSDDGGDTWTSPKSLYDVVYNATYKQGKVQGSFAGSGRGLLLQRQKDEKLNGRIMFAMSHRFPTGAIQEYIIYSDDEGQNWKMSPSSAFDGGDESKLVELEDGTVMISVRRSGDRGFNTSKDGGMTWGTQWNNSTISGNACNGDILYYNKHVLLHSYINNASRKNVTVCASYDNGRTWVNKHTICAPSSVYSTMDILPDGQIAMLYEDGACSNGFILNYVSFPANWVVAENPAKEYITTIVSKARTIANREGYTSVASATVGQCSKATVDALKALLPADDALATMTEAEIDALGPKIEAAMEACKLSCTTVPGHANTDLLAIKSFDNITSLSGKGYLTASASTEAATDDSAQQWQLLPASTDGKAYIKAKGQDRYLYRSENTLAVSATPQEWLVSPSADGTYVNLIATHKAANSYLVVNFSNGSLNWFSSANSNATWSTKFVLAKVDPMTSTMAKAKAALEKKGVGYPKENSAVRTALQEAITAAETAADKTSASIALEEAMLAFKSATADIQMPEDGKVYTITTVGLQGGKAYMGYDRVNDKISLTTTTAETNADYPLSAKFLCKTTSDGRLVMLASNGVYLIWKGGGDNQMGFNNNKGYNYIANDTIWQSALLTLEKMEVGSNTGTASQDGLFGYVVIKGARSNSNGQNYFVIKNDGAGYDASSVPFFTTNNGTKYSSALLLEEATVTEDEQTSFELAFNNNEEVAKKNMAKTLSNAKAYIMKTGVGYPAADAASRINLDKAIKDVEADATFRNIAPLHTSYKDYVTEKTNISLPEDGKAYTMTFVGKTGKRLYMNYAENGYSAVVTTETDNSQYPMTAKLICRKMDNGKYVFVNNDGKYLAWRNNSASGQNAGLNGSKGYVEAYPSSDSEINCISFTISKLVNKENEYVTPGKDEDLLGLVKVVSDNRNASNETDGCYIVKLADNNFDTSSGGYFTDAYTSAVLIEETSYPNTVTLHEAKGIDGIGTIGTFSAPFRTIVPQGVKAHYISDANGTTATTVEIPEGEAIPANTGVLLTSDAEAKAVMLPALDETDATITGNKLGNSAGAENGKTIGTGEKAYILTNKNDKVAFYICSASDRTIGMNKSYLVLDGNAAAATLSLNFGTVTGISGTPTIENTADAAADQNAPVYDLTGRRVTNLQKGGIYIKGGKKFIVK